MCGNITEWGADVHPEGDDHRNAYSIDFQVWRPLPTVDDSDGSGCYSLVGSNKFTSIRLSGGVASGLSPSPPDQDVIPFQPGDVLGFYVNIRGEPDENNRDGVVLLDSYESTTYSESVWYARIAQNMAASRSGDCPYSVGSSGDLSISTQAAPVISIQTGAGLRKVLCD